MGERTGRRMGNLSWLSPTGDGVALWLSRDEACQTGWERDGQEIKTE